VGKGGKFKEVEKGIESTPRMKNKKKAKGGRFKRPPKGTPNWNTNEEKKKKTIQKEEKCQKGENFKYD